MPNSAEFYKRIFLHYIPSHVIVSWFHEKKLESSWCDEILLWPQYIIPIIKVDEKSIQSLCHIAQRASVDNSIVDSFDKIRSHEKISNNSRILFPIILEL